jgi:hypothetical protein
MKGKLIKTGNDYLLKDTNGEVLAITNGVTEGKKLSKQNCDEIFGVVYVEKLAKNYEKENFNGDLEHHPLQIFKAGFNKAMELNKDKVFTEVDLRNAIRFGFNGAYGYLTGEKGTIEKQSDNYIQSIQQPTEIDIEIVTEEFASYDEIINVVKKPILDSERCIILKKI